MLSYLSNRQTAISIGKNTSSLRKIDIGVAQGSKQALNGLLILYVDDAVLVYVCDTMEEMENKMQSDITTMADKKCSHAKYNQDMLYVLWAYQKPNQPQYRCCLYKL